ncbi:MAG: Na/Pi cotransporter family protein [Treponema sp.]|jgi:phosphate:Na+ symporter|nr:Na/Pi cotransporter family protein [Treponema sp.]
MELFYSILSLLVGCGAFLFGVAMFGESVRKNTTTAASAMLNKLGGNRFSAFGLGVVVTAIIQSSAATGVMVVSMVSAGVLTMFQGMAIMLGAHLGTTSTLFLIMLSVFRIREFFMVLLFVGALIKIISKNRKMRTIADFFIGFGILFVGLMLMSDVFRTDIELRGFFQNLFLEIKSPLLLILLGMVFTIIIQSSTAATAILLTMVIEGILPFSSAMFIALGAYGGTSSTVLLASIAAKKNGKRVAIMNCLFSVFGVIIFTSFLWPMKGILLPWYYNSVPVVWQLPFFQVSFNLILGLINIWFIGPMIKLVCKIIKDKPVKKSFGVTFLQDSLIEENIDIALHMAKKEILIVTVLIKDMFKKLDIAFKDKEKKDTKKISKYDKKIGILHKEIIFYLVKISQKELGKEETKKSMNYLLIQNELESIGDIIDKNLMLIAKRMIKQNLEFSKYGAKEITELHEKIMENIERMVRAFREENTELANEIVEKYSDVDEKKYQLLHIRRLNKWIKPSVDILSIKKPSVNTTSIHLDTINYYARINDHVVSIAKRIILLKEKNNSPYLFHDTQDMLPISFL